jgi:LuxR family quorum-sensing system transcriptional regulator CciR
MRRISALFGRLLSGKACGGLLAREWTEAWCARARLSLCSGLLLLRRLADRFGEQAAACATLSQLGILLADAAGELGFDHFALLHHESLGCHESREAPYLRIDNYPARWVEELLASGLAVDDPIHLASRHINTGFAWDEVSGIIRLTKRHEMILARGRDFGLRSGFTVPANVPGEPSGSCSFAVRRSEALPVERLRCAELVGAHAFRAARRIYPVAAPRQRPHLSRRELQCLRLVAMGKSDWEISRILGISLETARQYVKRARAAYDSVSRAQLVAYGLRDAWITFENAIPPSG